MGEGSGAAQGSGGCSPLPGFFPTAAGWRRLAEQGDTAGAAAVAVAVAGYADLKPGAAVACCWRWLLLLLAAAAVTDTLGHAAAAKTGGHLLEVGWKGRGGCAAAAAAGVLPSSTAMWTRCTRSACGLRAGSGGVGGGRGGAAAAGGCVVHPGWATVGALGGCWAMMHGRVYHGGAGWPTGQHAGAGGQRFACQPGCSSGGGRSGCVGRSQHPSRLCRVVSCRRPPCAQPGTARHSFCLALHVCEKGTRHTHARVHAKGNMVSEPARGGRISRFRYFQECESWSQDSSGFLQENVISRTNIAEASDSGTQGTHRQPHTHVARWPATRTCATEVDLPPRPPCRSSRGCCSGCPRACGPAHLLAS